MCLKAKEKKKKENPNRKSPKKFNVQKYICILVKVYISRPASNHSDCKTLPWGLNLFFSFGNLSHYNAGGSNTHFEKILKNQV